MRTTLAKIRIKAECFATYKTSENKIVKYYIDCKESMSTPGPITEEELLEIADDRILSWVHQVVETERKGILIDGEKPLPKTDLSLVELKTRNVCIELEDQEILSEPEDEEYVRTREKRLCYSERLI